MIMDTLGTLRKSLSRMLWSWGGVSSSSSWKTAKSHALNHPSKPTRFLVNHIDWKGRWKVVWNLVQYSWKSNRANQGFWQKRCLMETQGVQWACGLRMVGTCYLEIGKGSPEPREANPYWLHVTTWDFFWDNFEITNSIKFHRSTLSIFSRSVNWGPNFQSAALTGFHCTQVRCKPGAIEGRKCWPVFATCLNKTLVKLCGNHAWRDQIWCWSRSRAEAVDIRDTGFKYLRCKKMLAGLAMRTRGSSIQFQKIMRGNFIRIHNIDRFHEHAFLWTIKNSQEEPIAVMSNPKSTCDLASEI